VKTKAAILATLIGCAHARTPEQLAMLQRKDCKELLQAADVARANADPDSAQALVKACPQDQFQKLLQAAATPAQQLLLCGRAAAAHEKRCDARQIDDFESKLQPHLALGPADETIAADPLMAQGLEVVGSELNFTWSGSDPDIIVGKLSVNIDHSTSNTVASVPDAKGKVQHVPAVQHRYVAKASAQVELGDKTRVLRAQDEARDLTWDPAPRLQVAGKPAPTVPSEDELRKRAVLAWLRLLGRALRMNPPETVDTDDDRGCIAYGLALNLSSNDPDAAAQGRGDEDRIASCEKLLGLPAGAGIPVP
jgi:hypothetical protein